MTDNITLADNLGENLESQCTSELSLQINISTSDGNQFEQELQSIEDKICPNSCSGQGACSNGNCTCNSGEQILKTYNSRIITYALTQCNV